MTGGWVVTVAYVDPEGGQIDRCWGVSEEVANSLAQQLGAPSREYVSSPEVNKVRRELDEIGGTVIFNHDE